MKKFNIIMIIMLILISLLIIVFIITMNRLKEKTKANIQEYNVMVKAILDKNIILESPSQVKYIISKDTMPIYNISGNKINVSDLIRMKK